MTPRLYYPADLVSGQTVPLGPEEVHYLKNVMRREVGSPIVFFNEASGEFDGEIIDLGKKRGAVRLVAQLRAAKPEQSLVLAFAPVKRQPVELIIQKATELGVTRFVPVVTDRTNSDRLRIDRLSAIAREAAEQSGRLSVPNVDASIKLQQFCHENEGSMIIFCDEAGNDEAAAWGGQAGRASPLLEAIASVDPAQSAIILIGPEGGFSTDERQFLRQRRGTIPVTLGPRILRADTAAIVAVTLWQAAKGDLRET